MTTLTVHPLETRAGIRLSGDVDLATVAQFRAALANLDCGHHAEIHIDLGELHFIDAAGTSALINRATSMRGCRLVVHDAPYSLRRIIGLFWGQQAAVRMDKP